MTRKRFQIRGMHGPTCSMLIDMVLEDLPGVKSASTSYARQVVDVECDEARVSEGEIVSAIEEAGYTASTLVTDQHR